MMKSRAQKRCVGVFCASLLLVNPTVFAQGHDAVMEDLEGSAAAGAAEDDLDWGFTLYKVQLSEDRLIDALAFHATLENSTVWVAAISKEKWRPNKHIVFGFEGQLGKHTGPVQHHWEVNGLGTMRWLTFPWDRYVDTSAALGLGLSYATEMPRFEIQVHDTSSQWLAYILVEVAAALPSIPEWQLVVRIHHRSAAYGTFEDNLRGGSNGVGIGINYRW